MIREAMTKEDVDTVAFAMKHFEKESRHVLVDPPYASLKYQNHIRNKTGGIFMLINNKTGTLQGALGYVVGEDLHYPRTFAVETFWLVDPNARGRGLRLFDAFEKKAIELGVDDIAMVHMVDSHPEVLAKIYKRRGYELIESHHVRRLK